MSSNDDNQIKIDYNQQTKGYPNIKNSAYLDAIQSAKQGGQHTSEYFENMSAVPNFWQNWVVAKGDEAWIEGHDSHGNPVYMASDGNVQMQLLITPDPSLADAPASQKLVLAATEEASDASGTVGTLTLRTGATTNNTSQVAAFGMTLADIPAGLYLGSKLMDSLLKPMLGNAKKLVGDLADKWAGDSVAGASEMGAAVDEATATAMEDSSEVVEEEIAEVGAELAVDWVTGIASFGGLAFLAAVPIAIEMLGHQMTHQLQIHNLTQTDFNVDIAYRNAGDVTAEPEDSELPQEQIFTDMFGDTTDQPTTYSMSIGFENGGSYGSIGYAINIADKESGQSVAGTVIDIPWIGDNSIWVGDVGPNPTWSTVYSNYAGTNKSLTSTYKSSDYNFTLTINKVSETKLEDDSKYKYYSLLTIEETS